MGEMASQELQNSGCGKCFGTSAIAGASPGQGHWGWIPEEVALGLSYPSACVKPRRGERTWLLGEKGKVGVPGAWRAAGKGEW